jgi:hypothetical protein
VCLHWDGPQGVGVGHQPQGQCESLARPALSCRSKEGWGTGLRFVDRWKLSVFKMNLAIQMKQGSPSWRADKSGLRKLTPWTQSTQSTQSSHWIYSTHSTHSDLLTLPLSISLPLNLRTDCQMSFEQGVYLPLTLMLGGSTSTHAQPVPLLGRASYALSLSLKRVYLYRKLIILNEKNKSALNG